MGSMTYPPLRRVPLTASDLAVGTHVVYSDDYNMAWWDAEHDGRESYEDVLRIHWWHGRIVNLTETPGIVTVTSTSWGMMPEDKAVVPSYKSIHVDNLAIPAYEEDDDD